MPSHLNPATLAGKPLMLRRLAAGDFAVRVDGRLLGRIMRKPVAGGSVVWFWTLTGPYVPPELRPGDGEAETLDAAKVAIKAKFGAWLQWATGRGEVVWHG